MMMPDDDDDDDDDADDDVEEEDNHIVCVSRQAIPPQIPAIINANYQAVCHRSRHTDRLTLTDRQDIRLPGSLLT